MRVRLYTQAILLLAMAMGCSAPQVESVGSTAEVSLCTAIQSVVVVAHRGGAEFSLPENSIEIAVEVLRNPGVGIEIDVMQSRDGVFFLHHDNTLERTTTGTGLAREQNWNSLRQFRLLDQQGSETSSTLPSLTGFLAEVGEAVVVIDAKPPIDTRILVKELETHRRNAFVIVYNEYDAISFLQASSTVNAILGFSMAGVESESWPASRVFGFYGNEYPVDRGFGTVFAAQGGGESSVDNQMRNGASALNIADAVARTGATLVFSDYPKMLNAKLDMASSQLECEIARSNEKSKT